MTAWNRGAPQALRSDVQHAKRVQLSRDEGAGNCALLYVFRSGKVKLAYGTPVAGPEGTAGVWAPAHTLRMLGPPLRCVSNVRVLRGGTLVPL